MVAKVIGLKFLGLFCFQILTVANLWKHYGSKRERVIASSGLVPQKIVPALRGRAVAPRHVSGHRSLRHVESQFEQFAMDPRRAPQKILPAHPNDKVTDLALDPRPSPTPATP